MIENMPIWIDYVFLLAFILSLVLFYRSNNNSLSIVFIILIWSVIHGLLAYLGFYQDMEATPPRFALILIPTLLVIALCFTKKHQNWILRNRNTQVSTFIHLVRIPVEIVLFQLFIYKMVPELMTFEGRNFDILAGLSAPVIGFLYANKKLGKKTLLIWNTMGLLLVSFILVNGILSAKLPFQVFAFEQPNLAVMYFPYVLLPATIVPLVLWTHLTDIIKLLHELNHGKNLT